MKCFAFKLKKNEKISKSISEVWDLKTIVFKVIIKQISEIVASVQLNSII